MNFTEPNALGNLIKPKDRRSGLTLDALADVDAGRVIDHQTMQAWADRLGVSQPVESDE